MTTESEVVAVAERYRPTMTPVSIAIGATTTIRPSTSTAPKRATATARKKKENDDMTRPCKNAARGTSTAPSTK